MIGRQTELQIAIIQCELIKVGDPTGKVAANVIGRLLELLRQQIKASQAAAEGRDAAESALRQQAIISREIRQAQAFQAVSRIVDDLNDRPALGEPWGEIPAEIQASIERRWRCLVEAAWIAPI